MKKYVIGLVAVLLFIVGYYTLVRPHKTLIQQTVMNAGADDGIAAFTPLKSAATMDNSAYLVFSERLQSPAHQYTQSTIKLVDKRTFATVRTIPLDIILPSFDEVSANHDRNKLAMIDRDGNLKVTDLSDGTSHTVVQLQPAKKNGSNSYYYHIKSLKWSPEGNKIALVIQKNGRDTAHSCFRFDSLNCPEFREWNKLALLDLDSGRKQTYLLDDYSSSEHDAAVSPGVLNWVGDHIYLNRPGQMAFLNGDSAFSLECTGVNGNDIFNQQKIFTLDTNSSKINELLQADNFPAVTKGKITVGGDYANYCHLNPNQDLITSKLNQSNYTVEYFLYDRSTNTLQSLGSYKTDYGFMGPVDDNTLMMRGPYTQTFFLFDIATKKQTQILIGGKWELVAF